VTRVDNHLEVVLAPEDYRDDAMLTSAANNALTASATVPEGVEATAHNGNLTLTGAVKFPSQRAAAESAVSGLTGVRNIKDQIGLTFDVDPADVNRLIRQTLNRHVAPPDDSHVVALASGNTVTLVGHVRTREQRDAVFSAAWRDTPSWPSLTNSRSPADRPPQPAALRRRQVLAFLISDEDSRPAGTVARRC
jgi:osmotically-inducible protein OsmY